MADSVATRALELVTRLSKELAKTKDRLDSAEASIKRIEGLLAPKEPRQKMDPDVAQANKRRAAAEARKHRWKDKKKGVPVQSPAEAPTRRRKKKTPPR